jgi:hypothetical protein
MKQFAGTSDASERLLAAVLHVAGKAGGKPPV